MATVDGASGNQREVLSPAPPVAAASRSAARNVPHRRAAPIPAAKAAIQSDSRVRVPCDTAVLHPRPESVQACLTLNACATIDHFGEDLAFAYLDWLWDGGLRAAPRRRLARGLRARRDPRGRCSALCRRAQPWR